MGDDKAELDKALVVEVDAVATLVIAATHQAAKVATSLHRALADIAGANRSIRIIAAQNKVIALNAAIEAARSSEEHRGFGAVARQVKDLAVQSTAYADTIDHLVAVVIEGLKTNDDVVKDLNAAVERGMAVVTSMTAAADLPSSLDYTTFR